MRASQLLEWPAPWVLNTSASMPRGPWVLEGRTGRVRSGDVVALAPPRRALELGCARAHQRLLKRVVARGPMRVCIGPSGKITLAGRPRPELELPAGAPALEPGCHDLSADEVWLAGDHPRSCDSRIFGPVSTREITHTAHPTWLTWRTR